MAILFSNYQTLNTRINHHKDNLSWNIFRLYRARNKMVHSAKTDLKLEQLDVYLIEYYNLSISNIVYYLLSEKHCKSIENVFEFISAKYEFVKNNIDKNNVESAIMEILNVS